MECIYLPELNNSNKYYQVPDAEARHLKVLRVQSGDKTLITSGKGIFALATVNRSSNSNFSVEIIEYYHNKSELDFKIGLAIGILDNREKLEFAIEKSTELGVNDIFLLLTDYSQRNKINKDRLITKTINTIKQCKRSMLPIIHNPISIFDLLNNNNFDRIIIADESGINPKAKLEKNINSLIFVGSEGGFSKAELDI